MRLVLVLPLVLAALVASGCAAPEEEEDPLIGLCPLWSPGPTSTPLSVELTQPGVVNLDLPDRPLHQGRPVDMHRIDIDGASLAGTLELRAFDQDGGRLNLRDYRQPIAQLVPALTFHSVDEMLDHTFDVHRTPLTEDTEPIAGNVTLEWRLSPGEDGTGSFHWTGEVADFHRVCGVDG